MNRKQGSEYSGVPTTSATIQPKGADALTNGDRLRLGYLTGTETDPDSIEDRRQMMGLLPADQARPVWLRSTGRESLAQVRGIDDTKDNT